MGDQHCYECRWWQLFVPKLKIDECIGRCYSPIPLPLEVERTDSMPPEIGATCIGCKVWTPRENIGNV